ncbi:hypothetical protein ACQPYK_17090 [Streptosporangium sp. CA-135522]|uniref:hypothetical protein n=1 Tax=Streptosporangium sp. CA-135522 TaxID=3240072 RepID=UPI003D933126
MSDWDIIGKLATRRVNGQEVMLTAQTPQELPGVITAWERAERQRMLRDLGELGRLVDGAMMRLQVSYTADSRGEPPLTTGDLQ